MTKIRNIFGHNRLRLIVTAAESGDNLQIDVSSQSFARQIIVWDLETAPDLAAAARMFDLPVVEARPW